MNFSDLKLKKILFAIKYASTAERWQSHSNCHIIAIMLKGKSVHYFKDKTLTAKENDILFFNMNEPYTGEVLEKDLSFSIHFTTYEPIDTESFVLSAGNPAEIIQLFEKIQNAHSQTEGSLLATSYFYRLCNKFYSLLQKKYHPIDKRVLNMRTYIDSNFCDSDCLKKAYEQESLSRRHLDTLFKNNFDTTPSRYITVKRIELAKQLLKTHDMSVTYISDLCGFADLYYFSTVFKKETGMTPLFYRKKHT